VQRLVTFVHPDVSVFRALVGRDLDNHAAAARIRAVYFVGLDNAPFARWAPIAAKVAERVVGIFLGMLLPVRVTHPERVRAFDVSSLQRGEELLGRMPFGMVPFVISDPRKNEHDENRDDDQLSASEVARLVVLLRIHQRHNLLSIMESGEEEKVPATWF